VVLTRDDRQGRAGPVRRLFPVDPRASGEEPDYRFTLANERTFLAWIRTALALAAGGLGTASFLEELPGKEHIGAGLLIMSSVVAVVAYRRWALSEGAIRRGDPLPASRLPVVLAVGVAVIVTAAAVLVAFNG
jgi:putative membrane protein